MLLDGLGENTKIGEHLYILFDLPLNAPNWTMPTVGTLLGPELLHVLWWVLLRFSSCSVLISCVIFAITSTGIQPFLLPEVIIRPCQRRVARGVEVRINSMQRTLSLPEIGSQAVCFCVCRPPIPCPLGSNNSDQLCGATPKTSLLTMVVFSLAPTRLPVYSHSSHLSISLA